ncbi:type I restriction endonuclease subunit R, EcoR124 family [Nostoc sp.]|uniref:type I restriction endonuclease subunit R, EcoR124 family n=1 Tax=Nostoc sp. TaxID=1180 RepID=UPI002FF47751
MANLQRDSKQISHQKSTRAKKPLSLNSLLKKPNYEEKVETVFEDFWTQERVEAIQQLCIEENLKVEAVNQMIADYKFSGKEPLKETVLSACNEKPKLLERKKIFARVVSKLLDIINKFDDALGELGQEE